MGDDLDSYVYEFLTRCNSNNARTEVHFLSIFSSTLVHGLHKNVVSKTTTRSIPYLEHFKGCLLGTF